MKHLLLKQDQLLRSDGLPIALCQHQKILQDREQEMIHIVLELMGGESYLGIKETGSSDQSGRMEMLSVLRSTQKPNYSQFLSMEITNPQMGRCIKRMRLNAKYHGYLLDLQHKVENMLLILVTDHLNLLLHLILMYRFKRPILRIQNYQND